jgi:hypothetical protein
LGLKEINKGFNRKERKDHKKIQIFETQKGTNLETVEAVDACRGSMMLQRAAFYAVSLANWTPF